MRTGSPFIYPALEKRESSPDLFPPLQENGKAFSVFQKVQGAMGYLPDFPEACKAILDAVVADMGAENCSLMLMDPSSGELSIRVACGKDDGKSVYYPHDLTNGKRFKTGEGIAGLVLKEGRAVMLTDVREEPRFIKGAIFDDKVRSLVCLPVREEDRVVGVFNISHSDKEAFDEGDKLAMGYISNQVGAALTSARFFLQIQEMNRLMKDTGRSFLQERERRASFRSSSTFIEIGEMTQEKGIFLYTNKKMRQIKEMTDQVANTDVTVLIQGESGVGKEVVARSIHLNSYRRTKPFIKVNCAALPNELLESELFGYEKGAFTGAYHRKPGKFELAHEGTIFLDEIMEISFPLQAKLLQVLQDREFSRLGGKKDVRVDVRVLAATNKNVEEAVTGGRFREDLYYRLNVVNLTIPPLRERREEIPIFVHYFLDRFRSKYSKAPKPIPEEMMKAFFHYHWPGNVRELENVIQRFVVLGNEKGIIEELTSKAKEERRGEEPNEWPSLKEVNREAVMEAESEVIRKTLDMTNWNRKKAAHLLNISYKALLYKMKKCGLH